jgi:hypothetical protein
MISPGTLGIYCGCHRGPGGLLHRFWVFARSQSGRTGSTHKHSRGKGKYQMISWACRLRVAYASGVNRRQLSLQYDLCPKSICRNSNCVAAVYMARQVWYLEQLVQCALLKPCFTQQLLQCPCQVISDSISGLPGSRLHASSLAELFNVLLSSIQWQRSIM